jgi:hypothetical protein
MDRQSVDSGHKAVGLGQADLGLDFRVDQGCQNASLDLLFGSFTLEWIQKCRTGEGAAFDQAEL